MHQAVSISKMLPEYRLWIRELIYYREEIRIFEKQLEELVRRNTARDVLSGVEHFQNQFIRHKDVINQLKRELKLCEKQSASFAHSLSEDGMEQFIWTYPRRREEMILFRRIWKGLRNEFLHFKRRWL